MLALLEKTRMINKLLQNTEVISYKKMAEVLKDVIKANIYIVSSEGELLGYSILDGFECERPTSRTFLIISSHSNPSRIE